MTRPLRPARAVARAGHGLLLLSLVAGCPTLEIGSPPPPEAAEPTRAPDPLEANLGSPPEENASRREICLDDGLLLSRYDINTLRHRLRGLCCEGEPGLPSDHARCSQPWPGPEPMPCSRWGELQATLLARYGHTFPNKPELRAHFDAQPWYKPDSDFSTSNMTIVAKRNASTLDRFARDQTDCTP